MFAETRPASELRPGDGQVGLEQYAAELSMVDDASTSFDPCVDAETVSRGEPFPEGADDNPATLSDRELFGALAMLEAQHRMAVTDADNVRNAGVARLAKLYPDRAAEIGLVGEMIQGVDPDLLFRRADRS